MASVLDSIILRYVVGPNLHFLLLLTMRLAAVSGLAIVLTAWPRTIDPGEESGSRDLRKDVVVGPDRAATAAAAVTVLLRHRYATFDRAPDDPLSRELFKNKPGFVRRTIGNRVGTVCEGTDLTVCLYTIQQCHRAAN